MDRVKLGGSSQLFSQLILPGSNLSKLSELAKEHFMSHPLLSIEDAFALMEELKVQMEKCPNPPKIAKIFSLIIPSYVAENLHEFMGDLVGSLDFDKLIAIPEPIRAYITLRSCKDKKLSSKDTLERIERVLIGTPLFLYKFATCAAKRNVADFTKEVTSFGITEKPLVRRLAEIALYFDSKAFFEDLNEFGFREDKIREEFYLRGLIRSVDTISSLLDDGDFMSSLENLSPELLSFFYRNFDFCNKGVQRAIHASKAALPSTPMSNFFPIEESEEDEEEIPQEQVNEEKLFISYIQASSRQVLLQRLGFRNTFFYYLEKNEEHGFLAMILLVKSIDSHRLHSYMEKKEFLDFLREIYNFRDPATRFSIVLLSLGLMKKGMCLIDQLKFPTEGKNHPKMFSITLCALNDFQQSQTADSLESKWKNVFFLKNFVRFLAELSFSEKLNHQEKSGILSIFFKDANLQTPEILMDYCLVLSSRLTKLLSSGESPRRILLERQLFFINRLGESYHCSLEPETFLKLQYRQEISYYAQSLERLPEEEKESMVPFFFEFLHRLAAGTLKKERFNTPELKNLFTTYQVNQALWEKETESNVETILSRFPNVALPIECNKPFNIQHALLKAFEEKHLLIGDYEEFYNFALTQASPPPILEGKVFGKYMANLKNLTPEQKKGTLSHLFSELFVAATPQKQLPCIKKIKRFFSSNDDFFIDITNWEKAVGQKEQNKGEQYLQYKDYKIIRSCDPYILFRIGTIAGGSCQRMTGDPANNKCLLAYPSDGKNQAIYAQHEDNEPEARAIFRFFYACERKNVEKTLFPVLFLETFYPGGANSILRSSITLSAVECAMSLNVLLVRVFKRDEKKSDDKDFPFDLVTINGPAPFEYFDGTDLKIKPNNKANVSKGWSETTYVRIDGSDIKVLFNPRDPEHIEL